MRIFIALASVLYIALIGCSESVQSPSNSPKFDFEMKKWKVEELSQFITSVRPWSREFQYNNTYWDKIIEVAKIFHGVDTNEVVRAFALFDAQNTNDFRGDYLESSKAFLLLRLIFELPEHARDERPGGPGWLTEGRDLNPDGTVNLGWPLTWKGGNPLLASQCLGYEGFSYSAKSDYLFLNSRFKQRDLTHLGRR